MKRVIRRYANRRLYDTLEKRVITLSELANLVEDGAEIQVIDHGSGEDITELTLAKVFLLNTKKRRKALFLPIFLLEMMKERGHTFLDLLKSSLSIGGGTFLLIERKTREFLKKMVDIGKLSQSEEKKIREILDGEVEAEDTELKELLYRVLKEAWAELGVPSKEDIDELRVELSDLNTRLNRIEELLEEILKGS
jgi:polyhydroxyalkanoate synthesis repressor PhaR